MDKLAHTYAGKANFLFCSQDGPGSAAKYIAHKGLNKDGVLKHVEGRGSGHAYQQRYAAHKSLFNKDGVLKANNLFHVEAELKKVL
mmetsp:Transcript_106688/g.201076  ORF Transcript_106688/g.201076 Transcript_106688/m.201076 type:complete len:86 (-) Transcript_106688:73-330(-)